MKKLFLLVALVALASAGFAQSVDKVILVSDTTSVDMLIAKAAGEKSGTPVLVLAGGMLGEDTKAELASLGVKTVILVGGPVVIKPETQTELEGLGYSVVRLWGNERTGTSVEVAKYFWPGGVKCAILADDTKNSDVDTEVQAEASESAVVGGCVFIPVPRDTIPVEVLDVLNSLNVSEAKFFGKLANAEFRAKLSKLRLKEIIGDKDDAEDEVESEIEWNETRKLVIVAAPHWRDVLGHGGHAGRHTLVRIVASSDAVPSLVELIRNRNITDVRVVGNPTLADDIAAKLAAEGINATKISGNAGEVARKLLKETLKEWEEREREARKLELTLRVKIKVHWLDRLTDAENRLSYLESELASLNASGADPAKVALLQALIDARQKEITAIKTYIENGNFDTAAVRIARVLDSVEFERWKYKIELKVDEEAEIEIEEEGLDDDDSGEEIAEVEAKIASIKNRCNTETVEEFVKKARELVEEIKKARTEGDYTKAAKLTVELRALINHARVLGELCERQEKIASGIEALAKRRLEKIEGIAATTSTSGTSSGTPTALSEWCIEGQAYALSTSGSNVNAVISGPAEFKGQRYCKGTMTTDTAGATAATTYYFTYQGADIWTVTEIAGQTVETHVTTAAP